MFAKRLVPVILVVVVLLTAVLFAARPTSGAGVEERYVVRAGDTLWAIAAGRYAGDPREAIWRIKERNGLERSSLSPGQVLYLP